MPVKSDRPTIASSRRKTILFTVILAVFVFLCIDTTLYIFLDRLKKSHNLFHDVIAINDEVIDVFYQKYFDPILGWDIPRGEEGTIGQRPSPGFKELDVYPIKTFGDSFVYGYNLAEDETFQHYVEAQSGWQTLNYGVNGYGTDQALVKYRQSPIKSKYTIMGVLDENIARVVTTWWSFYSFRDVNSIVGTKPRFMFKEPDFVLIPNPTRSYEDLKKLQEPAFIETLATRDYWPSYHEAINAPPQLRWPALATLLPHLDFFIHNVTMMLRNRLAPTYESQTGRRRFYHLYQNDSEALRTLQYVMTEFVRTATERNEIPIIMIFPIKDTMGIISNFGKKPYQPLIDYLKKMNYQFIDFGNVFKNEDYKPYYFARDFHLSATGNQRVAQELVQYIKSLEN